MTRLIDADELKEVINSNIEQATKVGILVDGEYLWELLNYAIDNAPTFEYPFVHVIINHPRYGECDGWLDKSRQLLFFDAITIEAAEKFGWTWKEDGK